MGPFPAFLGALPELTYVCLSGDLRHQKWDQPTTLGSLPRVGRFTWERKAPAPRADGATVRTSALVLASSLSSASSS